MSSGSLEAENSKAAAIQLGKLGYLPMAIDQEENSILQTRLDDVLARFQRVRPGELVVFTRQLASTLEAGVPLVSGLEAVAEQIINRSFRAVVYQVQKDIEGGLTFSDALDKHHEVFPALVVNMIRAGEKAGILPSVLDRVSNLIEKDLVTIGRVRAATRYPLIVLVTLAIAFVILTTYVVPKFASFFANFRAELPLPTRILIGLNNFLTSFWYGALGIVIAGAYFFRKFLGTEKGRYNWDRFILSTPIFGPLFSKIYLSRFGRMLSAMLASGIPILEALSVTAATIDNKVISQAILSIRNAVSQGKSLAEPMRESRVFPPIAISMVAIGEKAGTLEHMLGKTADYFDREVDYTIDNLTPLIEPLLIFGLGFILLLFALGIFLPMWDLINVYKTS